MRIRVSGNDESDKQILIQTESLSLIPSKEVDLLTLHFEGLTSRFCLSFYFFMFDEESSFLIRVSTFCV